MMLNGVLRKAVIKMFWADSYVSARDTGELGDLREGIWAVAILAAGFDPGYRRRVEGCEIDIEYS